MDEGFDRNLSHRCPWKQSASASFGLSCQTVRKLGLHEVSGVWRQDLSVRHERSHSLSLAFIQPVARDAPKWVFISTPSNRYVLHFDKGTLTPADAFWSVTRYDKDGFQVANPLNRFAIGDRDKLRSNGDGSLDIYIQNESPGPDKESNWLPAPMSDFNLAMRLYSPQRQVSDGTWTPPPVKK